MMHLQSELWELSVPTGRWRAVLISYVHAADIVSGGPCNLNDSLHVFNFFAS